MLQQTPRNKQFVARPGASLAILFGTFFFFLCLFSLISSLLSPRISDPTTLMRVLTLFQAIFIFIVPALVTAVLSTKLPATMLAIDHKPKLYPTLLIILALATAIPTMNMIIEWNNNLKLPESMASLEATLRSLEESAAAATQILMGTNSVGSFIVTLLIVGVMAGLSEELFFRGALQRILTSGRLNPQVAVWVAAFIFSFLHFQFFGFVPRLLLGIFFGYILLWGNNLWYCIIAHATNNILAVTAMWLGEQKGTSVNLDTLGQTVDSTLPQIPLIAVSIIATTLVIIVLKKQLKNVA
ncbi:MAG: CPBP family intramembrane metalloprotease [Muribaculaceae bacterium]|nr:CPBP family intramembrane metalloprotease [Muribaculaceae bacterium]